MGRPKAFDRNVALDRATELFWQKGYESTSIQDLLEIMGIGRASLYDTFGSKHAIFCEALERYAERIEEELLKPLREDGSPRVVLSQFFGRVVDLLTSEDNNGCLMVKAALITAREDEETARQVAAFTQRVDDVFHELLSRALGDGELRAESDLRGYARFLTHSLHGLVVSACTGRQHRELTEIVRYSLSVIDWTAGDPR